MDDQLVIDASGAWVRKTLQLIAKKPLLPPEHFGVLPCTADHSMDSKNNQREDAHPLSAIEEKLHRPANPRV